MSDWLTGNVSSEATLRVRSAVWGRIRRRRLMRRASGALAAAVLLAMAFWLAAPPVETLAYKPPAPPGAPVWKPILPAAKPAPRLTERNRMAKAAPLYAERITIITDDPNVVIVLVADGGDE